MTVNKQGRDEEQVPDDLKDRFVQFLEATNAAGYRQYSDLVEAGLARELARIGLPLSLYTEWYWKIDLHNLFHFLALRMDPHAQKEIRDYAVVMGDMVKTVCPMAWEAFEDYRFHASSFSGPELKTLRNSLTSFAPSVEDLVKQGLSKREAREFLEKLARIREL